MCMLADGRRESISVDSRCGPSFWPYAGRVERINEVNIRFVHLTDSYVCMSVISKGRSSSVMLMDTMRKLAALQLGFNLYPILIHVESTDNPTDDASHGQATDFCWCQGTPRKMSS